MRYYPSAWLHGLSLGEAIACEVRLQIIKGLIRPGEKLSENRIAADFGTSRSPVREAMKALSNEGLIRLERMGAVVLGLSMQDVKELYNVRYLIESFAQQRLAGGDRQELFGKLGQLIDRMELAVKYNDAVEFAHLDFTFHETMVQAAGHNRILHVWNGIRLIVLTYMLVTTEEVFSEGSEKLASVLAKHHKLVDGLKSGDVQVIEKGVREYFTDSGRTLHNSLTDH